MFKKAIVYTLGDKAREIHNNLQEAISTIEMYKFSECTSVQKKSMGFSKTPLGNYVDEVNGDVYLCVTTQTKSANKHQVESILADKITKWKEGVLSQNTDLSEEGLEPSKGVLRDLKLDAELEVLVNTYPNSPSTVAVMFRKNGQVVVEGNHTSAEAVLGLVRKVLGSLPAVVLETNTPVSDLLDSFVSDEVDDTISLGNKAVFFTQDELKVSLNNGSLYQSEAQDFIKDGMMTDSLEVVRDGMISTTLRSNGVFDAIKFSKDLTCEYEDGDKAGTFLVEAKELCTLVDDIVGRLNKD